MLLRTYLMLSDSQHLEVPWETTRLLPMVQELVAPFNDLPEVELRARLVRILRHYLDHVKAGTMPAHPSKADLVASMRSKLQAAPVAKRHYDIFVNSVGIELYEDGLESARENRKYPSVSLPTMFTDRPDVLKVVRSERFEREKRWQEVEGPYTDKGHFAVLDNLASGPQLLANEAWVVPITEDERPERMAGNLVRLMDQYEQEYIRQWTDFFADLTVKPPRSLKEAIELYSALMKPEWPYLRLLRALEDHTQWRKSRELLENRVLTSEINRRITQEASQRTGLRVEVDVRKLGNKISIIPGMFQKAVDFGVLMDSRTRTATVTDTSLAKYAGILTNLKEKMVRASDEGQDLTSMVPRMIEARKSAEALLGPTDDKAKSMLRTIILKPLEFDLGEPEPTSPARPFRGGRR